MHNNSKKPINPTPNGPHYEHGFLENGLEYFILERRQLPICSVTMLYRIGSAGEESGKTGMAHFLEHMMFKGTEFFPAGVADFMSLRMGGETNAMTSRDYTAYFHLLPAINWADFLELEKDRMTGVLFTEENFNLEKSVVLEERSLYLDDPGELLYDLHYKQAFAPGHPYHHPVIGYQKDLLYMQVRDMQEFYRRHYRPENACIMIIGDVDIKQTKEKIKTCFNNIKTTSVLSSTPRSVNYRDKKFRSPWHKIVRKDLECMRLKISYPAHRFACGDEPCGRVLEELLAGARSSILSELLVEKLELTEEVDATLNSQELGGRFFIDCEPRKPEDCPEIIKAIEGCVEKLCDTPVSVSELEAACTRTITNQLFDEERLDELSFELMSWLSAGNLPGYFGLNSQIKALTPEKIQHYCRKIFQPSQIAITCACSEEQALILEKIWS